MIDASRFRAAPRPRRGVLRRAATVVALGAAVAGAGAGIGVATAGASSFGSLGGPVAPGGGAVSAATVSDVIVSVGETGGELAQLRYDSPTRLPAGAQVRVAMVPVAAPAATPATALPATVSVDGAGTHVVVDGPIAPQTTVQLSFDAPVSGTGADTVAATVAGPVDRAVDAAVALGDRVDTAGLARLGA